MKKLLVILPFIFIINSLSAQRVFPLVGGISVDSILLSEAGATKIEMDPVIGNLFYTTASGNIYEVFMSGPATDSLRYTGADHGISHLQGLYFRDSVMYLCGNVWSTNTAIGKVVKGVLQPDGSRVWVNIVTTDPYPTASGSGDHGFAGVNLDPAGNNIYVSSGARTHLGEVRTNSGAWPGYREVPMTSKIFKFPVATTGLTIPNDSAIIDNSGYVYAWGTRNAFDMAWDGNDTLFAIDNSGERDDPEELNWIREGRHYGFPWRMGGNENPLQFSPYDVELDPLVNHLSGGYLSGWFADDPNFPLAPSITFAEPVRNYGTVADFFRDPVTGNVKNAHDEGTYISTFTSHRSPLGLIFDRDSLLALPYRGDGFVLNFMPGGDSTGFTPLSPWGSPCPFVDPARELVQMKLTYDAGIDNYTTTTNSIVSGFYLPVDAALVNNNLYVIENGGSIWKITFPSFVGIPEIENGFSASVYPNPFVNELKVTLKDNEHAEIIIYDALSRKILNQKFIYTSSINTGFLPKGIYLYEVKNEKGLIGKGIVVKE
jgi:hypothetical protein